MVGMSSNLRPFRFIFILGKMKNQKGQDQVSMEGGIPQEYFLGQKLLNGKGGMSRSIVMVKKPTILKSWRRFLRRFSLNRREAAPLLHVMSHGSTF
jgi:hypothetical protein